MDFRRIEMIFLVVFIALDVFLFTSFRQAQSVVVNSSKSDITSVTTEMKSADISTGKLSKKHDKVYYLAGKINQGMEGRIDNLKNQSASVSDNIVTSILDNPLNIKGKDAPTVLKKFMNSQSNVLFGKAYKYNKELSVTNKYVFTQVSEYGEIFDDDAQLVFLQKGDQIVSYRQTYTDKISVLREEQDTISEQDAVSGLYTASEIPDNSKILWTQLNYGRLLTAKGSAIYIPVWQVEVKNKSNGTKSMKMVNAFNGTIMKNQQKEDVQLSQTLK